MNGRETMLREALTNPRTRANRPPDIFIHSKDGKWRAAVTVNK